MKPLSRKTYFKFGLLISGLLLGFVILEIVVRALEPEPLPSEIYTSDQFYGWKLLPDLKYKVTTEEGSFFTTTNSQGFREDRDYSYEKNNKVFRILVLGDSMTEAVEVPMENSFHRRLEDMLNHKFPSLTYEIINTGVTGYGTDNEYFFFKYEGYKYNPDLVILAFLTANDIRDNHYKLTFQYQGEMRKPYFIIKDNILKLRNFPYQRPASEKGFTVLERIKLFIRSKSKLYFFIGDRIKNSPILTKLFMKFGLIRKQEIRSDRTIIPVNCYIYSAKYSEVWQEAWQITKGLILKLKREVEGRGAKFVVVILTNPLQIHHDFWENNLLTYPKMKEMKWDLYKPEHIIVDFCNKNNITLLDLIPPFRKYVAETGEYLHFPMERAHWNSRGHKLASELIFEFLKENNLIPSGKGEIQE